MLYFWHMKTKLYQPELLDEINLLLPRLTRAELALVLSMLEHLIVVQVDNYTAGLQGREDEKPAA